MSGIALEGPKADIARWWAQINSSADAAYQAAGGRERPTVQHSSFSSRLYDAVADALAGRSAPGSGRPSVIVTVDAESLFEEPERKAVATQLGAGPIPESLLADYVQSGSVSAVLRRLDGAPLWFGRARRHSTDAQFLALAVRDRGCVLCRAGVDRCQAHHLMPWSAPGRGRTDVDQLALLCQQCHRDLHHRNHTLQVKVNAYGKRIWSSRPATPEETPAARPPQHRKRHRKRE